MAILETRPQRIVGNWISGVALDFQTLSSTPIGSNEFGHMQFETVRPEIAELLYQLKYRGIRDAAKSIIDTAVAFLSPHCGKFDLIVPVPASTRRAIQPVPCSRQELVRHSASPSYLA